MIVYAFSNQQSSIPPPFPLCSASRELHFLKLSRIFFRVPQYAIDTLAERQKRVGEPEREMMLFRFPAQSIPSRFRPSLSTPPHSPPVSSLSHSFSILAATMSMNLLARASRNAVRPSIRAYASQAAVQPEQVLKSTSELVPRCLVAPDSNAENAFSQRNHQKS